MPPKTARGPKKRTSPKKKVRIPKTSRLTGEAEHLGTFEGPGISPTEVNTNKHLTTHLGRTSLKKAINLQIITYTSRQWLGDSTGMEHDSKT